MHFLQPLLRRRAQPLGLYVDGRDEPVATILETAFDSASRKRGLLGRDSLPDGFALVIAPCSAVHTFAMRFPIDIVFARRDGRIVKLKQAIGSARVSAAFRAFAVVEMPAGTLQRANVRVGDRLCLR